MAAKCVPSYYGRIGGLEQAMQYEYQDHYAIRSTSVDVTGADAHVASSATDCVVDITRC